MTDGGLGICQFRFVSTDLNLLLNVSLQNCLCTRRPTFSSRGGGGGVKLSLERVLSRIASDNLPSYQFPL